MKTSNHLLRRLTAALLAAVLALSIALPVFASDDGDTIYINSVSDLLSLARNCAYDQWSVGKTVILQKDLSLEGMLWEPIPSFSGQFKGSGHTISDLTITGQYSPAGLFGIVEEQGSIESLSVRGVVSVSDSADTTTGGIVGINHGTLISCQFTGVVTGDSEVGGIVGRNESEGTIDHSTARAIVTGKSSTGGIAGYNLGAITGCTNVGSINTEYPEASLDTDGFTAALEEYFDAQHAEAGLFGWMTKGERSLETGVYTVSDTAAASELLSRVLYDETPRQAPVDARIVLGEDGYTVDPGSKGNLVNLANCVSAIAEQLPAVRDLREESPVIEAKNAVIRQSVTAESPELLAQRAAIDAYLATEVTLDFQDGNTYTLTPQDIWRMSDVTLSDAEGQTVCAPVPEKVKALSDALADEYALDGVYAKFHNAEKTRPYIYYRVGDTGWILDRDALALDIAAALETETDATVTPSYDTSWYWKQEYWFYNFTDTFVEISLDNQYMWYYVDGKLLVETPVVTGNIAAGDDTRRGCFRIASMTTDTYLVGPTWNDHVEYWMPFDDQIGLHDSSWRTEYGGDIYLTDGSHGCVNTPLDAIATIYNNITVGTLVVVY